MSEPTYMQQRIHMRHTFKDVMESLQILDRHSKGLVSLDPDEVEQHALTVDFAMEEINEIIEEQMRTLVPDSLEEDHEDSKVQTGTGSPEAH